MKNTFYSFSPSVIHIKIQAGRVVAREEDWTYRSARDFCGMKGLIVLSYNWYLVARVRQSQASPYNRSIWDYLGAKENLQFGLNPLAYRKRTEVNGFPGHFHPGFHFLHFIRGKLCFMAMHGFQCILQIIFRYYNSCRKIFLLHGFPVLLQHLPCVRLKCGELPKDFHRNACIYSDVGFANSPDWKSSVTMSCTTR